MALAEIAADPALRREAEVVAPMLARRAEPAGPDAVRRALQPLVLVYGVGEAARSAAFWAPYRILAELPPMALERGVSDYTAAPTSEFFPKPGPLKALCEKHAEPIRKAASRAQRAQVLEAPRPRTPPTEADQQLVRRMAATAAEALSMTAATAMPHRKVDLPATHGAGDERGLTPQMRALMARRAQEARR